MQASADRLIVFVKAPRPGLVKTRLAAALGPAGAASAYRTLVETLLARLRHISQVELRFAPNDALVEIRPWLQDNWVAQPQGDGDLGERLASAFADAFAHGARKVVIIGSDCPSVMLEDIHSAWAALANHDLVLGPATDGGYWLIGLRRLHEGLFRNIAWSTSAVLQATLARARDDGLSGFLLRELADVDTEEDWRAFLRSIEPSSQPKV